jgi:hypothetical protein
MITTPWMTATGMMQTGRGGVGKGAGIGAVTITKAVSNGYSPIMVSHRELPFRRVFPAPPRSICAGSSPCSVAPAVNSLVSDISAPTPVRCREGDEANIPPVTTATPPRSRAPRGIDRTRSTATAPQQAVSPRCPTRRACSVDSAAEEGGDHRGVLVRRRPRPRRPSGGLRHPVFGRRLPRIQSYNPVCSTAHSSAM